MNRFYEAIPFRRLVVMVIGTLIVLIISPLFLLCFLMMVIPAERWGGHGGSRDY